MASMVSDGLAGFADASKEQEVQHTNTPHYHFFHSMLIPSTVKLQKELRGRRFKEVQTKLQVALNGMQRFKLMLWPQEESHTHSPATHLLPSALPADSSSSSSSSSPPMSALDAHLSKTAVADTAEEDIESTVGDASTVGDSESTVGDFSKAPAQDDGLRPFDDASTATTAATTVSNESLNASFAGVTNTFVEDDPQTKETMHESIVEAIEAYVLVLEHKSRTNKACELALQCIHQLVIRHYVSGRAGGRDDDSGSGAAMRDNPDGGEPSLVQKVMLGIQSCSESNKEPVQKHCIDCLAAMTTSPKCGIHEASMLLAIRIIFHVYLVSKSTAVQKAAKAALWDMVRSIIDRMEESPYKEQSLFYTDTYYLLRSLVKLSSKALPGIDDVDATPGTFFSATIAVDPLALNNKVLSLELILQAMESAGDLICNGERFIQLVQSQLCVALLKNCMSNHPQVAFLSQKIFLILVYKFKTHLKDEIQVFMTNIFLRVLDSENSSFSQKALVLESLRSLCDDPLLLTQIFLNYDCDLDSMNLYKDIVLHLTKLSAKQTAQQSVLATMSKKDAEDHVDLSLAGVEVLVTILHAFLKALGMPSTNEETNDVAGKKIRKQLDLEDIANDLALNLALTTARNANNNLLLTAAAVEQNGDGPVVDFDPSSTDKNNKSDNIRRRASTISLASSMSGGETSSDVAGKIVDVFDRKRNLEQNFELGAVKFTLSLKSGLKFFIENGFTTLDAKEIAMFFLVNKDKLDKTQMGEVLGKEPDSAFVKTEGADPDQGGPGFFVRVLHHYIDALDFTGMMFDDAIRLFLSGFRLPGEAQKIDRIMEKFAERFTRQNPEIFPNSDTAFILAFSVIMLNTDLHNPSIKPERRMTLESFLRNNRGIGENGSDLPEEFLGGIFERIKERPFSLKEDDAAREKAEADALDSGVLGLGLIGTSAEERKKEKFKKEREEMMSVTEQLIRRRKGKASVSKSAVDGVAPVDVVKPMFDVTWGPIIGILSQVLELSSDDRSTAVCLNGFVYAIRVAAHSNMALARDTFVSSLAKFTFLGSIKEMKPRNIESIRTLMNIALIDGEFLGESWGPVLQCISQLARMRMSASGLDSDESFLQEEKNNAAAPRKRYSFSYYSQTQPKVDVAKETEEMNEKVILETVSEQLIDSVFSSTVKLSTESLAHFIEQLVAVSKSEIEGESKQGITGVASASSKGKTGGSLHGGEQGPSIFSLQRLVEVADYNMDVRPRLVWTQVWEIMTDYYAQIGCHRNAMVRVFAIDSLKQLGSKFLEKPELSEFNLQRIFLQPFLRIIKNPVATPDIRELILECVNQIINTKAHNLQSGWKVFFDIIIVSAKDSNERITLLALNILQRLLDENLDQLFGSTTVETTSDEFKNEQADDTPELEKSDRNSNANDFIDMCRASLSFVQLQESKSPRPVGVSMRALCHTAIYADLIADGRVLPPVSGFQSEDPDGALYTYDGLSESESLQMALWRPLFEGLASCVRCTSRSRAGSVGCLIQRGSVLAIRALLLRHGSLFSVKTLQAILQETVVPAFEEAARKDVSPVISITSESPAVSSLDFLVEPMPLPPPRNDPGLLKFEEVARSMGCAPQRPLGPAELLVEACFTDMRHGGDGDLTQAYKFAKKDMRHNTGEQPFPDSWISTTGPVALGCLTDICSEIIIPHGAEGVQNLWPCISGLLKQWFNGDAKLDEAKNLSGGWTPCEALVRIACNELNRFASRLPDKLSKLDTTDAARWANCWVIFLSGTLSQSLDIEYALEKKLLKDKLRAHGFSVSSFDSIGTTGHLEKKPPQDIEVDTREADPIQDVEEEGDDTIDSEDFHAWIKLVPKLKIRCVAAHFLQQTVSNMEEEAIVPLLQEEAITTLLKDLNRSREISELAVKNEDIAHAFQEAMLTGWGLDDEIGEEALVNVAKLSHTQGSAMFFLTQTAGATKAVIQLLGALHEFEGKADGEGDWDREAFAAPHLLEIMKDVLSKFVESEAKEGHRIDPNVWRNTNESGIKVAVYCTSFASVVVGLLKAMLMFQRSHFEKNKNDFFPMVCRLVRVQSDEIRHLVQRILLEKFGPMFGVEEEP